jgi:AraC family transcriptional regulator
LTLAETVYPAGLVIPPHEHANAFFCFVVEGRATRSWCGRAGGERPMALTVFPAGVAHGNCWGDSGGRVLHVEFTRPWLERLRGRTTLLDRPADYERGRPVWLARRLVEEWRGRDDVAPLAAEGLVLELLAECARSRAEGPPGRRPGWLGRVDELLHARFAQTLSLQEIAAAVRVSADHLARTFRRCHGRSVGEYVRELRVEFACRRLAESETPLAQIALDAGFADQSHFTKTFRRHMGITPLAFRKLHRRRRPGTNA